MYSLRDDFQANRIQEGIKEEGTQEIKRELLNTLSKEMQSTRRHKVLRTETKRDRS